MIVEQEAMQTGGGGLVIEANDITSQSSYTITNSIFTDNTAGSGLFASVSSGYLGLSRGGGISVVFRGTATNNTVQLNNVRLEGNMAQFGAGLFLALYGNTSNNTVSIDDVKVMENKALETSHGTLLPSTSGGGALIELATTGPDYPSDNTINITSSRFVSNAAEIGGGLTVSTVFDSEFFNADNKLIIENCNFDNNKAFQGSSVYLTQNEKSQLPILDTTISDSNFTNGHCGNTIMSLIIPCSGSVLLRFFSLTLMGVSVFSQNSVSALSLRSSSSIELLSSSHLQFISNSAVDGAALHIVDCSSLVVNSGTTLLFKNNTASYHGGAIYSESCTFQQTGGRDCFIRHSNTTLHPDEWNITVTFTKNQASGLGDAIYIDSFQSCIWPDQHSLGNDKLYITFCWNGWSFIEESNCVNQLRSGPANITGPTNYTLYPGECINLKYYTVRDGWGNDITDQTDIRVEPITDSVNVINSSNDDCECNIVDQCKAKNSIECEPLNVRLISCSPNHSSQILVHPSQFPGIAADVQFKPCDSDKEAVCNASQGCIMEDILEICDFFSSICNETMKPFNYYTRSTCSAYVKQNCFEEIPMFYMCGSCAGEGYGIPINVPQFVCTECDYVKGVFIFLFVGFFPVFILMIILAVFHINIVSGSLNGFILYSQLVSLQFPGLGYSAWIPNRTTTLFNADSFVGSLIVYSIWNLNFLTIYPAPLCLPYINTASGVFLLQYVIAACPLLFIVVSSTWIKCYNNGYRLVVTITRPVHRLLARFWQKFNINPSLIDTYAGLILLSYMRFLAVSVKLLSFTAFGETFSGENIALAVLAVLCLLVFGVLPIVFLLFYHLKTFQQCLTCCKLDRLGLHALVDAYQGCFKNSATGGGERRYFAGIYLLFRFVFVITLFCSLLDNRQAITIAIGSSEAGLTILLSGLALLLRPYKTTVHNIIDFLLLLVMGIVSAFVIVEGVSYPPYYNPVSYNNSYVYAKLSLLYLPFLVLLIILIYRVLKYFCCACGIRVKQWMTIYYRSKQNTSSSEHKPLIKPVTTTEVVLGDYDSFADRINNPVVYAELTESET